MIHAHLPVLSDLFRQVDYPATRSDLVRTAERGDAEAFVVEMLESLPARSFNGTWDVRRALESRTSLA